MATGGGSDNNDRPRMWRKREHEHLIDDGASERSLRPRSTKAPRRRTSEPSARPPTPRPVDPPVIDLTVPSLETIRIDVNLHQPPSSPPPPPSSSSSTARLVPTSNPYTSSHTFYRHHGHFVRPRPYNLRPRPQQTPSAPPSTTTPTTSAPEAPLVLDSDSEDDLDDVIILNETPPRWQSLFEDSVVPENLEFFEPETFGTTVSVRSIERQMEEGVAPPSFSAFEGPFQRDFMQSFLTVSFPHVTGHYDGNFTRHFIEHHMTQLQPMQVISYIMGTTGATFGGTMGSYEDWLDLAERLGPGRPLGLPDDAIDALPVRTHLSSESSDPAKTNCVICMMDYEDQDTIKILPCSHEYHSACISPWLKQQRTCPICRNELTV